MGLVRLDVDEETDAIARADGSKVRLSSKRGLRGWTRHPRLCVCNSPHSGAVICIDRCRADYGAEH